MNFYMGVPAQSKLRAVAMSRVPQHSGCSIPRLACVKPGNAFGALPSAHAVKKTKEKKKRLSDFATRKSFAENLT